jgi:nucleoside-diphosphate-sugar epimerase
MSSTMLVLGAGYVGRALAASLGRTGASVFAMRRTPDPSDRLAGVTWLAGDARTGRIAGLPARVDAIVLCAAPTRSRGDTHDSTYAPLAAAAVSLAVSHGASVLAYTSSTGVYGVSDGGIVTEASPTRARNADTQALLDAESTVLNAPLRHVVLRAAGIYGPGRSPVARLGSPEGLAARGEYWVNLIHRDDLVRALLHAVADPVMRGAYNTADGAPERAFDVARWIVAKRGGAWPDPLVFRDAGAAPRSNQRVDVERLKATGWTPRYPTFREGFASFFESPPADAPRAGA